MILMSIYLVYAGALLIVLSLRNVAAAPMSAAAVLPGARILIIGGTGGTGRELVAQALERGYAVTALIRVPSRLAITHPNLTVIRGDVLNAAAVDDAVAGQNAVVCALGHKRFFGPSRILSGGTRNLLRASEAHGVSRLICQTSLGIGNSAGHMGLYYTLFVIPVILPFYFWDKTRQEQVTAAGRTPWIIVRPAALSNGAGRGRCRSGQVGGFVLTPGIRRADVARFMLDQLTDNTHLGTTVGVAS